MKKKTAVFVILILAYVVLFFYSIRAGTIDVTYSQIFRGLFVEYDEHFAMIYDLRFPRIMVAMLAGASLAVSGVMFQAVMKNPLADPGIIGVSSGASFTAVFLLMLFPQMYVLTPIFAFVGGLLSCLLIYLLSWKSGLNPLRVILVGIAINAVFTGIMDSIAVMVGARQVGVASIVNANIAQKTWSDVGLLTVYVVIGLIIAVGIAKYCNLLALEDKTIRALGINVDRLRIFVSFIAVLLASITTAIVGVIGFLGLIVPHIGRLLVGSDHKLLIPFSVLSGGFLMLLCDTLGRVIAAPYEIPVAVSMAVLGGPFFIFLLRRSEETYGS
ncbi:FecCD family ABC transporter permease [Filifactor villosus]|uniref:Probable heme-iron transport system permease protein IsdF n=1 Tax=Filifactor villosus TaxID=29374 RepID=A0ABV9QPN6_9FIRM